MFTYKYETIYFQNEHKIHKSTIKKIFIKNEYSKTNFNTVDNHENKPENTQYLHDHMQKQTSNNAFHEIAHTEYVHRLLKIKTVRLMQILSLRKNAAINNIGNDKLFSVTVIQNVPYKRVHMTVNIAKILNRSCFENSRAFKLLSAARSQEIKLALLTINAL